MDKPDAAVKLFIGLCKLPLPTLTASYWSHGNVSTQLECVDAFPEVGIQTEIQPIPLLRRVTLELRGRSLTPLVNHHDQSWCQTTVFN